MKRIACAAVLMLAALPAWPAKKITVAELKDMLMTMHQQNKSDADVANALKQVQLTEELSRGTMNDLVPEVPGQLSTEQIYVLEARSSMLPPPSTDIPATPAPDASAQQALLAKADAYAGKTYADLPAFTTTRTTLRFQDNVEALAASSGMHGSATDVSVGSLAVNPNQFIHYINASDASVVSEHGAEKLPEDKTRWGGNGMVAAMQPDPNLTQIWSDAHDAGEIKWLRWQQVNGKPAAVFAFSVPKKKSHFAFGVCCFPKIEQAGIASFTSSSGFGQPGGKQGQGGGAKGNFQTNTDYNPYRTTSPYHGAFFLDPDTGIVVRLITQPEQKATDVVHQWDTRIDYSPTTIGDKTLVVPIKTYTITEVVPYGESGAGGYRTRVTLFTSEYKNYQPASTAAQK